MSLALILLIAAGVAFVLEAGDVKFAAFSPKWWALGIALYLFSLAAG